MKRIAVTGAAGQIAYNLLFRLGNGELFGKEPIALHLLDVEAMIPALEGVKMELEDCAFTSLKEIHIGSNPNVIFKDVTHAFLLGAKPRGPGMERGDLLKENGVIFIEQGVSLNKVADRNVKVLVVGNPCNTNCLIALKNAKDLPKENFYAMTRLDQNRGVFQLAKKSGTSIHEINHFTIWGNHSSTMVPDFLHATIKQQKVEKVIEDPVWLENDFIKLIQKRGAAIIDKRGKSSAASAAHAALQTMQSICFPTLVDQAYSLAIYSEKNPYGIDQNLIFSFPCRTNAEGKIEIIPNLQFNDFFKNLLKITQDELIEERGLVFQNEGI